MRIIKIRLPKSRSINDDKSIIVDKKNRRISVFINGKTTIWDRVVWCPLVEHREVWDASRSYTYSITTGFRRSVNSEWREMNVRKYI